jgi:hypothetical protein
MMLPLSAIIARPLATKESVRQGSFPGPRDKISEALAIEPPAARLDYGGIARPDRIDEERLAASEPVNSPGAGGSSSAPPGLKKEEDATRENGSGCGNFSPRPSRAIRPEKGQPARLHTETSGALGAPGSLTSHTSIEAQGGASATSETRISRRRRARARRNGGSSSRSPRGGSCSSHLRPWTSTPFSRRPTRTRRSPLASRRTRGCGRARSSRSPLGDPKVRPHDRSADARGRAVKCSKNKY